MIPPSITEWEERKQIGDLVDDLKELCTNGVSLADGETRPVKLFCLQGDQKELHRQVLK